MAALMAVNFSAALIPARCFRQSTPSMTAEIDSNGRNSHRELELRPNSFITALLRALWLKPIMNGTELPLPAISAYKKLMFIKDNWAAAPYSNASIRI